MPALPLPLALVAGILIAPVVPPSVAAVAAATAWTWAAAAWRRDRRVVSRIGSLAASLACGVLLARAEHAEVWRSSLWQTFVSAPPEVWREPQVVTGVLTSDPVVEPYGAGFDLRVSRLGESSVAGGVRATVAGASAARLDVRLAAGDRVRAPMRLHAPHNYADPGVSNHVAALARDGIVLNGSVKSALLVERLAAGGPLARAAAAGRRAVRRAIAESFAGEADGQPAAIVRAILIGDRGDLSDETVRSLQAAGTFHVIAISGGNVAILVMMGLVVLRALRLPSGCQQPLLIVCLVAYGASISGGASVTRAIVMATVYLLGRTLDIRSPAINSLAWAATVVLAWQPSQLADAGFQLTFVATLAIVALAPRVPVARISRSRIQHARARAVANAAGVLFVASAAAEAGLLPIGAVLFHRVTFAGLALNFLAIPIMTLIQALGIALVLAFPLSATVARACAAGAALAGHALTRSADLAAAAPALSYRTAGPSAAVVIIYYSAALGLLAMASREGRFARAARIVTAGVWVAAAVAVACGPRRAPARALTVTFADVGQGLATLVEFPGGDTMVVDAGGTVGGRFDVGEGVVSRLLWARHIRRIDDLVVTHGDPDHAGGAPALLRNFAVGRVVQGIPVERSAELDAIAAAAARARVPLAWRLAGDGWVRGGVEVRVLSPPRPDWQRLRVRNDDSLVIELDYGRAAVLLTGDIGPAVERDLVRSGALVGFRRAGVRVAGVPHHGSLGSSSPEFVAALQPTIAVVSAGPDNWFGHPAPAVVARYEAAGSRLFRTDREGAISVSTTGETARIDTFSGMSR